MFLYLISYKYYIKTKYKLTCLSLTGTKVCTAAITAIQSLYLIIYDLKIIWNNCLKLVQEKCLVMKIEVHNSKRQCFF